MRWANYCTSVISSTFTYITCKLRKKQTKGWHLDKLLLILVFPMKQNAISDNMQAHSEWNQWK